MRGDSGRNYDHDYDWGGNDVTGDLNFLFNQGR
jgi:hypothetical protein